MTEEIYRIRGDSAMATSQHAALDVRTVLNRLSPMAVHIRYNCCQNEEEAISFETGRLTGITEMLLSLLEEDGMFLTCIGVSEKTNPEEKIFQIEIRVPKVT